jgi:hypothetical protein
MESATQGALNQLLQRGIEIPAESPPEAILDLWNAVEEFEAEAAARACDSFTNTIESSEPDDEGCVLPRPRADESLEAYTARVRSALR